MIKESFCAAVGIVGSCVANALGGWDNLALTLILFMCIDYITGAILAAVFHKSPKTETGTLESNAGWKGLCKKCVMLLFVIVAHYLDVILHVEYIRDAVIIGFITNELISIVENAGLMGIPMPAIITKSIEVLKNKSEVMKK